MNARIQNSTSHFLIFAHKANEDGIEVRIEDETVWLTQRLMALLFQVDVRTINEHISNIFQSKELKEKSVIRKFRITAADGKQYNTNHYNLDIIIAVGFRVNSERATQFRQWAINVLRDFSIRGYLLDHERLKNGALFDKNYFDRLLEEIREIRASERLFYQKITDIYATAADYNATSEITRKFFATVQNKLHWAIHHHTAAELIVNRADSEKDHMGLSTWKNAPQGKILKSDVIVAKNYLTEKELHSLNRIVGMYLDYAEDQAEQGIPMSMADWSERLNAFLKFNHRDILDNIGKVTQEMARQFAEGEFAKYRIFQDRLFASDFDKFLEINNNTTNPNTEQNEE
jgi:hypothetical protein